MQDSNSVILVDENGQPYIAHSIRAEKGNNEWKLLEREFDRAKDNLDFAKDELERYEKPYRQ